VSIPGRPRGLRGAIAWAFTTYQPEAPFELVGLDGQARSYPTAPDVARAIRANELAPTPTFHVEAKLRPLVLLQDRPLGALPEYAALKLARFAKLNAPERQRVRDGDEPALFHLPLDKVKYGLSQENAVDLNSLVRVHRSAIVTSPVGYLDLNQVDVLGRRLATFLDIDLEPAIRTGVLERWERLVAAQQARRGP
jgi:hypothetical protein